MTIKNDLESRIANSFRERWTKVDGRVVPETKSIALGNTGKEIEGAVLYADIDGSTSLVDSYNAEFAAEIYKAFHICCSKIVRAEGGEIRSFDGDRLMAVFIGQSPCTDAATAALKINWSVRNIINPGIKKQYPDTNYVLRHTVGIDFSKLLVVRAGIRDNNDLVWVGSAANHAAKLNAIDSEYPTWITEVVYDRLLDKTKYSGEPKVNMWEKRIWKAMGDRVIYRSNYWWALS